MSQHYARFRHQTFHVPNPRHLFYAYDHQKRGVPLNNFLNENTIISTHQSGFRNRHSTEKTLLYTTNQLLVNMDKGLINGILFLDLKGLLTQSTMRYLSLN